MQCIVMIGSDKRRVFITIPAKNSDYTSVITKGSSIIEKNFCAKTYIHRGFSQHTCRKPAPDIRCVNHTFFIRKHCRVVKAYPFSSRVTRNMNIKTNFESLNFCGSQILYQILIIPFMHVTNHRTYRNLFRIINSIITGYSIRHYYFSIVCFRFTPV